MRKSSRKRGSKIANERVVERQGVMAEINMLLSVAIPGPGEGCSGSPTHCKPDFMFTKSIKDSHS
jgi:hypothetical protein